MTVRDLPCWPPKWRGVPGGADRAAGEESGVLIARRWDVEQRARPPSVTLTMEVGSDRYSAVLDDEPAVLAELYILLSSQIGRPLAKIESLPINGTS